MPEVALNGEVTQALPEVPTGTQLEEAAQRKDYTSTSRSGIDAATWRRFASGSLVVALLALVACVVLANKYQHDVFVYRATPGGLVYDGQATQELSASNYAIASQLGHWVQAYRNVPGDNAAVDSNVILLEASTADYGNDHALSDLKSWIRANNPKLERKDFTRNVRPDVDALHQPGTNTWNMTWIEDVTPKNGVEQPPTLHHGVMVILPEPRLPTDNEHVNADPAGVTVVHYELH